DRIKLLDLGIAKLTAAFYTSDANATPPENRLRTRAGVILGTPGYIAPELLHGDRDPQPRHDVFALGVTLYKLATGASPYAHPHAAAVGDPPRPAPNLPRALAQILHRAVAADPSRRYPSMAELQDDLELLHEELAAVANTGETSPRRPSNPSTPRLRLGADAPRDPSPPAELSAHTGASLSARSRASSASPTSTPRAAHLRRSLPWLVAAVLALGWLADARLLDTQPGDLITGTQAHAATILRAAEIALPTIQPSTALAPEAGHAETTTDSPDAHASATGFSTTQTDPAASAPLPLRSEPRAPATLAPPAAVDSEFAPPRTTPAAANRPGRAATSDPTRAGPPPRPARTRTDLLRAVTDRRAALDLCLPGDGLIDLRLAIAADGHLLRATTIPAGSTIAQECVAEALADLRLPAAGAPSTHTIHLRER
ncbi:MAG TPA: hypothetical protein PKW35_22275, partial [Nannocystaceae bacterium]|nr:hypothetical protein [Nannocystaceae bacterium]